MPNENPWSMMPRIESLVTSSMNRAARFMPYCLMTRCRIWPSNAPIAFLSMVPATSCPLMIWTYASFSHSSRRQVSQFWHEEARKIIFSSSGRMSEKTCLLVHNGRPSSSTLSGSGRFSRSRCWVR